MKEMLLALLALIFYSAILGLIFWLFLYLVNTYAPEPFKTVFRIVIMVVFVVIVIYMLIEMLPPLGNFPSPFRTRG